MKKIIKPLRFLSVTLDKKNQRIDNFLFTNYKKIPKNKIYKNIRKGNVRVNKKRVYPKYKLNIGDKIRIPPTFNTLLNTEKNKDFKKNTNLIKTILLEDDDLLIINKPPGIAVHGGSGISLGIIEQFRNLRPLCKNLELIHRLDKDTSGILLISKKRSCLNHLHQQMREKKVHKHYTALVHGLWPKSINSITSYLLKINGPLKKNFKKVIVHPSGKLSKTQFKIEKYYKSHTLMSIFPITGRTHQIRVHTANAGFPIVFDNRYGSYLLDKKMKQKNTRLLLHAKKICFIHPNSKKKIFIKAPLKNTFNNYLNES